MLIMNTHGDTITNVDNVKIIGIDPQYRNQICAIFAEKEFVCLGEYDTEKRT